VLGDRTKFATHPLDLDLVRIERIERIETSENKVDTRKAGADLDEES
jgi:hypothetical protein